MSKLEQELISDLDCLRLASDLTQLANYTPSPTLKAYILRMVWMCNNLVDRPETRH
jgi:hypothetical protein